MRHKQPTGKLYAHAPNAGERRGLVQPLEQLIAPSFGQVIDRAGRPALGGGAVPADQAIALKALERVVELAGVQPPNLPQTGGIAEALQHLIAVLRGKGKQAEDDVVGRQAHEALLQLRIPLF